MSQPVPTAQFTMLSKDLPTTVVNAAVATGVAKSFIFTVQENKSGQVPVVTCAVTGTFTVGTVTLQGSQDGFATNAAYSTADTAIDVAANKFFQLKDLTPGFTYRFTVASITGTSVTINAVVA